MKFSKTIFLYSTLMHLITKEKWRKITVKPQRISQPFYFVKVLKYIVRLFSTRAEMRRSFVVFRPSRKKFNIRSTQRIWLASFHSEHEAALEQQLFVTLNINAMSSKLSCWRRKKNPLDRNHDVAWANRT